MIYEPNKLDNIFEFYLSPEIYLPDLKEETEKKRI